MNAKENVTVEDIIALHAEFEYIHPFQDGNGRVGRLVALKECLRHGVIPAWTGRIHLKDLWICWKYSIDYTLSTTIKDNQKVEA